MIEKTKNLTVYLYKHHFVRYLFVGGSTFILDISLLIFFYGGLKINIAVATSLAYWLSIAYNFVLNRYWTFSAWEKESLRRHLTAYLILLAFNYLFAVIVVSTLSHFVHYSLAKVIAVAVQMLWTFPIYKHYIFTRTPDKSLGHSQ